MNIKAMLIEIFFLSYVLEIFKEQMQISKTYNLLLKRFDSLEINSICSKVVFFDILH